MSMELWVIVAAGSCLTGALAALAVLILGVHAEVKRLVRTAEALQQALAGNLRQMATPVPPPLATAPAPPPVRSSPSEEPEQPKANALPPLARLAEAVTEAAPPLAAAQEEEPPPPEPATVEAVSAASPDLPVELLVTDESEHPAWNPDRRLLVTRLLGRGKNAEQIAAALRIPLREVEEFLEANQLLPLKRR